MVVGKPVTTLKKKNTCLILLRLPWVPEDIFFLWTLMVRGEAALTRRKAPRRKK